jgi:hypothetical protein
MGKPLPHLELSPPSCPVTRGIPLAEVKTLQALTMAVTTTLFYLQSPGASPDLAGMSNRWVVLTVKPPTASMLGIFLFLRFSVQLNLDNLELL